MKKLILVLIVIVLIVGCSESITGPEFLFDTPTINYPKSDVYIEVEAENDTIIADWEEVEGTSRYFAIIHYDSVEVAKPDSISIFANSWHTAPAKSVGSQAQQIFTNGNRNMLIVDEANFEYINDTIKIFWKIRAVDDSTISSYSDWSNIESFYVVNADL